MKSLKLAVLGALAFAITACGVLSLASSAASVLGTHSTSVSSTADKVIIEGTRGLILANNAYQAAANGLAPFVANKRFPPATVDRIEKLNNRALFLLQQGDAGMTAAQRAAGVFAIADELSALAGK